MPRNAPANRSLSARGLLIAGVGGLGLVFVGVGLSRMAQPPEAPTAASAGPASAASAPTALPPVAGPSTGVVDLHVDAPATTDAPTDAALCPGCDVLLVTVCSLRKDHVGVYGVHPDLTPSLDRVAASGFHFDRTYAASNFTLASLTAILTGRFGSSSGVTGWDKGLGEGVPTLPEILGVYGYRTGAFTVDAPSGFRPDYGLHRGFQTMKIIPTPRDTPDGRWRSGPIGPGGASAQPVVDWFSAHPAAEDQPLFTMFHTRTAHFPFVISDEGADDDPTGITRLLWEAGRQQASTMANRAMPGMAGGTAQQGVVSLSGRDPLEVALEQGGAPAVAMWRQRYAEAVGRMDQDLARVLDALDASGRADHTIVLVVADHGETNDDHGEMLHGDGYYNNVVNVPLLLHVPGLDGRSAPVDALVSQVDILPTLLELVGAVPPAGIDGVSMVPLLTGDADAVRGTTLVEGGVARQAADEIPKGAVVTHRWAMLRQQRGCGGPPTAGHRPGEPATCLFDLDADFAEEHDVAGAHADVVEELTGRWDAFRAARQSNEKQFDLDPAFVEELQRTGYDFDKGAP